MGAVVLPPLPWTRSIYSAKYLQADVLSRAVDADKAQRIEALLPDLAKLISQGSNLSPRLLESMPIAYPGAGLQTMRKPIPNDPIAGAVLHYTSVLN